MSPASSWSLSFGLVLVLLVVGGCRPPVPVVIAPKAVANPMPTAEQIGETQAAKDGRTGAVRIGYCVDPDGKPQDVKVLEPFEPSFDALALDTVRTWTFEPATKDGVAFEQCTDTRIDLR
jgi:TonB family protein